MMGIDGGPVQPDLWYVVALMERGAQPMAYSGPYHGELKARDVTATIPVQPAMATLEQSNSTS